MRGPSGASVSQVVGSSGIVRSISEIATPVCGLVRDDMHLFRVSRQSEAAPDLRPGRFCVIGKYQV